MGGGIFFAKGSYTRDFKVGFSLQQQDNLAVQAFSLKINECNQTAAQMQYRWPFCRLPSLRAPRDLTLGGVTKKTFAPNILPRRKNEELVPNFPARRKLEE